VGHGRPSRARAAAGEAASRLSWAGAASVRERDRAGWQGGGWAREVASGLSRAGATARPGRRSGRGGGRSGVGGGVRGVSGGALGGRRQRTGEAWRLGRRVSGPPERRSRKKFLFSTAN
jgi:hypothetical protein